MMYSYQTSQGIVHDLQWVPADTTQVLLTDAQLPNTVSPQITRVLSHDY